MGKLIAKHVTIKMDTYLVKYLRMHEDWQENVLLLDKKIFPVKSNNVVAAANRVHHSRRTALKITVLMKPSTIRHQAAMIRYYEECFFKTLTIYVDARARPRHVYQPIREFLQIYGITYDDYDFDSIWKRYQRELVKRKKRAKSNPYVHYPA